MLKRDCGLKNARNQNVGIHSSFQVTILSMNANLTTKSAHHSFRSHLSGSGDDSIPTVLDQLLGTLRWRRLNVFDDDVIDNREATSLISKHLPHKESLPTNLNGLKGY